jgi:uncharacterized protein YhaN
MAAPSWLLTCPRERAKLRPPVPFIADDIMETFDDFRAEETLRVFEDPR